MRAPSPSSDTPRGASLTARIARLGAVSILVLLPCSASASEKIEGIVERVTGKTVILDSSRIRVNDEVKLSGDAARLSEIEIGDWAEASGDWNEQGIFEAARIKVERLAPGASFADKLKSASEDETKKLDKSGKIHSDEAVTSYVSRVGMGLVPEYAGSEFSFSFSVIQDPSLNAFALPNGAIYVHTGLLAKMDNEAQLATVLGHEISHVTQLHGQRQYKKMIAVMIPAQIGALVLGTEVQRRSDNPVLSFMTAVGLNLGMAAAVNGYGRTLEDQADRVGLRYAVETGYDPRESPKVWDTFNDVYGEESKTENFFYSNHSTNEVRKQNLKDEIELHYAAGGPGPGAAGVDQATYQVTMLGVIRENAVEDFNLKRYRLAEKGFERVLAQAPEDAVAHHYQGRILLATKENPESRPRSTTSRSRSIPTTPKPTGTSACSSRR